MSAPIDTGGAAFPMVHAGHNTATGEATVNQGDGGMTLRDYFAGLAMQGMYASDTQDWNVSDDAAGYLLRAKGAYGMADAMLKARGGAHG